MSDETVVRELLRMGRATRAELAVATGLSKPTVADAIRRLEAKRLVRDTGERTSGRGGVGTYYEAGDAAGTALAVTIAPEGIVAELIDASGTVVARSEREVDRPADSRTVRRTLSATVAATTRSAVAPIVLATVSAADLVDRVTGQLIHLPDSPFLVGDLDPTAVLARIVHGPILVDNDVNWAARHELALRAERDQPLTISRTCT